MEGEKGMRWEGILKKESVRVLLAESDDCTREIVAALLRKCGYRVASASDGLKAWEILKANRQDMDLILMEVELPLLSGFDLLTLIMENETLKNIPVIMMSSHDYIGMVFKFMLKGAADFLVKPLRKNELRNLWQHVWRRSSLNGALGETRNLQDAKPARQKFEVDLENDAASNLYGDHISHAKGSEDEKGCDTQSSCTWPDMDAEGPYSQSIDEYSEKQMRGIAKNSRHVTQGARDSDQKKISATHIIEAFGCNDMYESFGTKGENSDQIKPCIVNPALVGVLDKPICAQKFEKIPTGANAHGDAKVSTDSYYPMPRPSSTTRPKLELSLKMNNSGNYDSSATERQNVLNHSTFSPFSRYSRNSIICTHPSSVAEEKEGSHHQILLMEQNVQDECFHTPNYAPLSKNKAFSLNGEDTSSTLTISSNQEEKAGKLENPHINPYTVPAKNDNSFSVFFPSVEPTVSPQIGAPPWMTDTAVTKPTPIHFSRQLSSEAHNSVQSHQSHGQNAATEEYSIRKQVEVEEIINCSSPVGEDRSSNTGNIHKDCNDDVHGSVCNGSDDVAAIHLGCGGIPSLNAIHLSQAQRSIHREAALNKFRQKRKERCFEKKVRYQSRKKLADQRPRIKGQFVRHVSESAQANSCGNDLTA